MRERGFKKTEEKEVAEVVELANGDVLTASQFLTLFLFPPAQQYTLVNKLSGGEKRRLQLLRVLVKNPNFLILDEPTNDLDLGTLNILDGLFIHLGNGRTFPESIAFSGGFHH